MLKRLYVRFLLWALGPVLLDIQKRQAAADASIMCASGQLSMLAAEVANLASSGRG
jgi:hypothetical protein